MTGRPRRREQKRRKHAGTLERYWALKESRPCADCGRYFHHAAMSFDHLSGSENAGDVAAMVRKPSRRTLLAEMAKCELVCANCHAVRTFTRGRGVAQPG
ncbi:MAG TPA: hypothetical protein VHF89_02440 [Solirubrobacteraceae bacterium]|nr:hypothetical protein [Solirubrobacteraceae bacterium]